MKQAIPILRTGLLGNGSLGWWIAERGAVGEKDIELAIVVVIEERDSGAHGFGQVFFGRMGREVLEADAEGRGGVDELARHCGRLIGRGGFAALRRKKVPEGKTDHTEAQDKSHR